MARWQYQVEATPPPQPPIIPVFRDNSQVVFTREFQYNATVNPGTPILPSFGYFQALSEPTRRRPSPLITAQQVSEVFVPGAFIPNFPIFSDFTEITFTKSFQYQSRSSQPTIFSTENITLDKWYQNFVPLPSASFVVSESVIDFFVQLPETVTVDKWYQDLSKPTTRPHIITGAQQALSFVELVPLAQLDIRWFRALSEPVRYRWFPASEQQGFAGLTIPIFPTIGYADVIVQTWNVLPEVDTWVINLDLTGCDCGD